MHIRIDCLFQTHHVPIDETLAMQTACPTVCRMKSEYNLKSKDKMYQQQLIGW